MRKDIMLLGIGILSFVIGPQSVAAQAYERESASGKVRFQCELEVPVGFDGKEIQEILLENADFGDSEMAYKSFVEGQEIAEQYYNPASDLYPEENSYILANGTHVDIGIGFGISTEKYVYYGQIGATNKEHMDSYAANPASSVNEQEAVKQVKEALEKAGYPTEDLDFQTYLLSAEVSKEIEAQYILEDLLEESDKKEAWTKEDDACVVYARQNVNGLPVYPELSVMAQSLAYDTPDSSPVVAICSSRGIESLRVFGIYNFKETGETITLKTFDEIAETVETKYENLLDDLAYVVDRAKFYERVYLNENQKYDVEPIWYLELTDNNSGRYVMFVNAETGKEIYLM